MQLTTLDRLGYGERFEIVSLRTEGEIRKRLLDMGFIPGARGVRLHQGILNDPIELELGSFKVSVRQHEAHSIQVIPLTQQHESITEEAWHDPHQPKRHGRGRNRLRRFFDPMERHRQQLKNFPMHNREDNVIRIALAGNPNTGKSSLYNLITGGHAHVGNYAGVTVDTKRERILFNGYTLEFIDLPGIYSLSAYSFEEVVSRDFILLERPDVVLDVMDATNLERNLYLLLQFRELGVPIVGALNMIDEAEELKIEIDTDQLSQLLQIALVKTSAVKKRGINLLLEMLVHTALEHRKIVLRSKDEGLSAALSDPIGRHLNYGALLESYHDELIRLLSSDQIFSEKYSLHWVAIKLIEDDYDAKIKVESEHIAGEKILKETELLRVNLTREAGMDTATFVAQQRYGYIRGALKEAVNLPSEIKARNWTERVDSFSLHRFGGLLIFFGIMYLIYSLTFALGNPISDGIDKLFTFLGESLRSNIPEGMLQNFLVEGVLGGVGGVLVFLPIIVLLFAGLAFLEDTGYMARAAFVMDKIMHKFGLHGRSFIPMMIGTGCAVPAVMATRTLASPKDRIITAIVTPMMMCSAKTPVVAMLVDAFFAHYAGLIFWLIWLASWFIALISAWILSRTLFQGEMTPFVMELPPYRLPTLWGIGKHIYEKAIGYIKKAATIILAASILTWIAFNFPQLEKYSEPYQKKITHLNQELKNIETNTSLIPSHKILLTTRMQKELKETLAKQKNEEFRHTIGARFGKVISVIFAPLGFDWKMSVSLLAAMPAKEIVISTLGVVYGLGNEIQDYKSEQGLKNDLRHDTGYNGLVIIVFIIFLLIYTPCFATLAIIKRELDGWRWVFFSAGFSFGIAYLFSFLIYRIGSLFIL